MGKLIPLTRNREVLVDDELYDELNRYKWFTLTSSTSKSGYAARSGPRPQKQAILMHRVIMNALTGDEIDHINGNTLDNRRINLRVVTRSQNVQNSRPQKGKYKGVSLRKGKGRWRARIMLNGKLIHLGDFKTAEEAAKVYDESALFYFGDYAWCNFPRSS